MSVGGFRFLHTSDWQLDRPILGAFDVPAALRESLIDAPYTAAERAIDAALLEEVDFVLLAGNVADPTRLGARGFDFLTQQFARLEEHRIAVYWTTGARDAAELWPSQLHWPANVTVFPANRCQMVAHVRNGDPLAAIVGQSCAAGSPGAALGTVPYANYRRHSDDVFYIALACGRATAEPLSERRIDYWALGGMAARNTLYAGHHVAHYSGAPQSRSSAERGSFGCTLVDVDANGTIRSEHTATDEVRWLTERITLPTRSADDEPANGASSPRGAAPAIGANLSVDAVVAMFEHRCDQLAQSAGGRVQLVQWQIVGDGNTLRALERKNIERTALDRLHQRYGQRKPSLWSVGIDCQSTTPISPAWYEEDTFLGDVLRELRSIEEAAEPIGLADYLPSRGHVGDDGLAYPRRIEIPAEIAAAATIGDRQSRSAVLREAAELAARHLGGYAEEANPPRTISLNVAKTRN